MLTKMIEALVIFIDSFSPENKYVPDGFSFALIVDSGTSLFMSVLEHPNRTTVQINIVIYSLFTSIFVLFSVNYIIT